MFKSWLEFCLCIGRNYKWIYAVGLVSQTKKTQKEFNFSYARQFKNHLVEGVTSSWSKFNRRSRVNAGLKMIVQKPLI